MSRTPPDVCPPDIESLFAAERVLVPEPEAARRRAFSRARAAVSAGWVTGRTVDGRRLRGLLIGKAAAAILLLGGLTAAAYGLGYSRSRVGTGSPLPSVAPQPVPVPVARPFPAETPVEALSEPAPGPSRRPARHRPRGATSADPRDDTYAQELRLLRPAQVASEESSFARALALVAEHQRRFPSGHLAEEREALRIKSLLGLGRREEARKAGAAFRGRFPNSALSTRIQAMLGTDP